ncbi:MAG: glycosyltransferase family 2 protein [Deltaproteobacteria bacterium]
MGNKKKTNHKEPGRACGITFIVPCLNEAENLMATISGIKKAVTGVNKNLLREIIIFDDFSSDATGAIADELAKKDPNIRVVHNEKNMGFGYNYNEGVGMASLEYVMMVPGDNEVPAKAIKAVIARCGDKDIIIPYIANQQERSRLRSIVSRAFTGVVNQCFGLGLKYYNGPCIIKSGLVKGLSLNSTGFAYMASILVRLINGNATYVEVPIEIQPRAYGSSKAFKVKNILSVARTLLGLFWEVRVLNRPRARRGLGQGRHAQ